MFTTIIIPARMASTRLPHKPLVEILGKSLIMRVYEQASKSTLAQDVIVATDHASIFDHVMSNGGKCVMTSSSHVSGTDRIAEVAKDIKTDIVINVQGDEPLIDPKQIDDLIVKFQNSDVSIATHCRRILDFDNVFDFNVVKVVRDMNDRALYFSRQAIPAHRDIKYSEWPLHMNYYQHVGIYGFRKETLMDLALLPMTSLEKAESLEQLRWMQQGYNIHCYETIYDSIGVDTQDDIAKVEHHLIGKMNQLS
jgi:3-deoxy-manno-octulosonate cytidylyltransferase (CMP-KDO synthetase)